MRGIFISYRRDDAEGQAGRLFDDLSSHFGRDAVFMDVAGIKKGLDFRRIIDAHVASCGVLLVIIGKQWLSAADANGKRRLDDANDFVRLETAAALSRDIPVVPVLVHGAVMPTESDLPSGLKELAYRNGTELTHARWDSDVKLLVEDLRPYLDVPATAVAPPTTSEPSSTASAASATRAIERSTSRGSRWAVGAVAMVVAGGSAFGFHFWNDRPVPKDRPQTVVQAPPIVQPVRGPVIADAAPPSSAKSASIAADESSNRGPTPDQVAAKAAAAEAASRRAAAARAAAERAAATRQAAEDQRKREEAERATQLAEEQRKRDEEARKLALQTAEKDRLASEQAAGARMFADIATALIAGRQNNRR